MVKKTFKYLIVVGVMLIPGIILAQTGNDTALQTIEGPYKIISSPLQWAKMISLGLAILTLVLIVLTVILERLHVRMPLINYQRFVYLFILPLFIFPFASFTTIEESKSVEFCGSCHSAMGLYVDDMKNKNSNTLAATHYQNRFLQHGECYQCHVGYRSIDIGIAKSHGLLHLYHWLTGSPTGSGKKQIKLYGKNGYSNNMCFRCHSGSKLFLEAGEGVHKKAADYLVEGPDTGISKISCLKCHGPAHLALIDRNTPEIFTGKGLVTDQQGMNVFPGAGPGESYNLNRPYAEAPPGIPHNIDGYVINKYHNTCMDKCHNEGLEKVSDSHYINEFRGERNDDRLIGIRYNCLQCHATQSTEVPIVPQMEHFKISASFQSFLKRSLHTEDGIYQGAVMCKFCHSSVKIGNQYGKWSNTKHSRAYTDLATERGKEIALQMGVTGGPQNSAKCLPCHSTGYKSNKGRDTLFNIEDGVQCEQCHGAGNGYVKFNIMKMIANNEIDAASVGQIKPDKKLCMTCHDETKHDHILPFDEKKRFKKIAHKRPTASSN